MTRAAALKSGADSIRAVDYISLGDLDQAAMAVKTLCCVCHAKPRAVGGRLTRCLDCLQRDVEVDREQREVLEAKAKEKAKGKTPASTKACRRCKISKPVSEFSKHGLAKDGLRKDCKACVRAPAEVDARSRAEADAKVEPHKPLPGTKACRVCKVAQPLSSNHRLAKDGRRKDCKVCVKAEKTKRVELTEGQRVTDVARRAKPHRRAANRAAVRAWTARNPMAARARRLLRRALKAGKLQMAPHCQARDCTSTRRLEAHHADYHRPYVVVWLCAAHHRRAHWSGVLHLADGLPRPACPAAQAQLKGRRHEETQAGSDHLDYAPKLRIPGI